MIFGLLPSHLGVLDEEFEGFISAWKGSKYVSCNNITLMNVPPNRDIEIN